MEDFKRGKHSRLVRCISGALLAAVCGLWSMAATVYAVDKGELPVIDERVAIRGDVVVEKPVLAAGRNTLNINQTSDRAVINWESFNIGANATVNFNHSKDGVQNTAAMTLNRVTGGSLSEIYGQINAVGSVIIVNPQGVMFASGSEVNAAGIVASTAEINPDKFYNSGELEFAQMPGGPNADITVDGSLTAAINGDYLEPGGRYARSLAATKLNIGERKVVTALSTVGNKIMLVADGDVTVESSGRLTATTKTNIKAPSTEVAPGFTVTTAETATAEGSIILRADQNADDVNASGIAAKVTLANAEAEQIRGLNIAAYFNGDIVGGVCSSLVSGVAKGAKVDKFTKKNYKGAASYAATLQQQVAQLVTKYENAVGDWTYTASTIAPAKQNFATLINDVYQLQCIENNLYGNLSGNYALGQNIAAEDTANWSGGFNPIGIFAGSFSGYAGTGSYNIYNLTINRNEENCVGLFGQVSKATITGIAIVDPLICGRNYVGGIVGNATNSTLRNLTMRKRVATLDECSTTTAKQANVSGTQCVGGIVGYMDGSTLMNGENGGMVSGEIYVGGLVGKLAAVDNGPSAVSGGRNRGYYTETENITHGYGTVYGLTAKYIGGVIGGTSSTGSTLSLIDSWSNGQVLVDVDKYSNSGGVGGLVGYISGNMRLERCYNTNEAVTGATTITDATATKSIYGQVTAKYGAKVGGIAGYVGNNVTIEQVYNTGNITGANKVGGLVGYLGGTISDAYNADNNTVLVDATGADAKLAYRDANIIGTGELVGILVGAQESNAVLNNTYGIGTINGVSINTLNEDVSAFENTTWLVDRHTAPLLRAFLAGTISAGVREVTYDGTEHELDTSSVTGYYGDGRFVDGRSRNAQPDGAAYYSYVESNLWSPQHGYLTSTSSGLMVQPKEITYTVAGAEREYGSANPEFSGSFGENDIVAGDTVSYEKIKQVDYATRTNANSLAGIYENDITVSGLAKTLGDAASNYRITVVNGTLTITPKSEPTPTPEPAPLPTPNPEPGSTPEPLPNPAPEPTPKSEPMPEPAPVPTPDSEPLPNSQPMKWAFDEMTNRHYEFIKGTVGANEIERWRRDVIISGTTTTAKRGQLLTIESSGINIGMAATAIHGVTIAPSSYANVPALPIVTTDDDETEENRL